ncbi:MAG TPA: hypothetical protein VHN79_00780, partial [Lacunisphaera sp.]|nr:hypothetical protein [Lacunisphaera sp.]
MSFRETKIKRRVWVGAIAACVGVAGWTIWSRSRPAVAVEASAPPRPFVQLAGTNAAAGDQFLREKSELLDPTPL